METLPAAIANHLDQVVAEAALLPTDRRVRVLDAAVSRLQAVQADALRDLETSGGLEGSGCKTAGSWVRLHLRRGTSGYRLNRRAAAAAAARVRGRVRRRAGDRRARGP